MTDIRSIDYEKLANMSAVEGVPFEKLCERAEKGRPLRNLVAPTEEWIDYREAAKVINCQYGSIASYFTDDRAEVDYWGIEWKTRSTNPNVKFGKRGCGVLFKRSDVERVAQIRRAAGISTAAALRVFEALFLDKIYL